MIIRSSCWYFVHTVRTIERILRVLLGRELVYVNDKNKNFVSQAIENVSIIRHGPWLALGNAIGDSENPGELKEDEHRIKSQRISQSIYTAIDLSPTNIKELLLFC